MIQNKMSRFLWVFLLFLTISCKGGENNFYSKNCNFQLDQSSDTCILAVRIKQTIEDFVNNKSEVIYQEDFISAFEKINQNKTECYFPNNSSEVKLYYFLGDSILLKKVEQDERAMQLLINLYLVNRNNAELSEYYGSRILPKAALMNIKAFIEVLSGKPDRDINKCIGKLKYIRDTSEIERIKSEIDKIDNQKYSSIIQKIRETLP